MLGVALGTKPNNPVLVVAFVMPMDILSSPAAFALSSQERSARDLAPQSRARPKFIPEFGILRVTLVSLVRAIAPDPVLPLVSPARLAAIPVALAPEHGEFLARMVSLVPRTPAPGQFRPKRLRVSMANRFHGVSRCTNL